jgi:predicted RecA/RadA family phage recombinase
VFLDVIQVQVVGGDPWAALIPAIAILISLTSVALTFWFRWSDSARVELKVGTAIVGADPDDYFVAVTATNKGRTGTTVVESVVLVPKAGGMQMAPSRYQPWEDALPWTLGPGQSKTRYFPQQWVVSAARENNLDPKGFRALATSGHGKFNSKLTDWPIQLGGQ